ncbi:hypothetical protein DL93DRAFT_2085749 [Clavulina sp. PMI_390]|nr:hypothetical protein DL93DRAFT_2085749 [Clavulina sp. PMI_390]
MDRPPPYSPGGGPGSAQPPPSGALSHPASGPTPINSYYPIGVTRNGAAAGNVAFVPYYDPRSTYSLEVARQRAWSRFVGALLWALVVYVVAGFITGGIVVDAQNRHRHRRGVLSES